MDRLDNVPDYDPIFSDHFFVCADSGEKSEPDVLQITGCRFRIVEHRKSDTVDGFPFNWKDEFDEGAAEDEAAWWARRAARLTGRSFFITRARRIDLDTVVFEVEGLAEKAGPIAGALRLGGGRWI